MLVDDSLKVARSPLTLKAAPTGGLYHLGAYPSFDPPILIINVWPSLDETEYMEFTFLLQFKSAISKSNYT